ncbi:MAG: LacI family DNA-binding transcriptional regulator [Lachnospiraceae bacterium]|nr:LacI family transcriptional regulator [Lachnospiraceae bacterium]MCI7595340.1 LacI family transcriptional regulator [Lachnospiraceae bacterium]MDD7051773.1 LacI family DNA-binding transcriptional regulator [Lachnospiraceae bacterium]MDY3223166.1 LacI family DNA-binding transcriptional regulator [Lachnospiraceae bacterium]MDY4096587.1 LacI family DNA-binding transcriptional regulator [Lachnospiraceae bacterium]
MVSIKDVAKHAGVAISTVSKVLNGYPNISENTRKKVNQAVEELNYIPNCVAAALSSKQAGRVALMIDLNVQTQATDEIAMRYIFGAITKAMELNLDVTTIFGFMFQHKTTEELIRYLKSHSITGIIIYGVAENNLMLKDLIARETFKCVVVDDELTGKDTSSVSINQKKAQYEVAKKMLESFPGKRVLYICGDDNSYVTVERLKGIQCLAKEMDLEIIVKRADFSALKSCELVRQMGKEVDAIVCASDLMALGAKNALLEMGIERPLCGFDGISLMGYAGQEMYTIRQNFSEISARAMEELQRLMSGKEGRNVEMNYTLLQMNCNTVIY